MKKKLFQYTINSLAFKLFLLLLLAVLPASGLLLYNVHLSRVTLVEQVVSAHQNALETYALQIETQLDSASLYLTRQSFYDSDVQIVSKSDNETDIQYAYQRILDSQNSHLTSSDYLDGIFTFIRQQDGSYKIQSARTGKFAHDGHLAVPEEPHPFSEGKFHERHSRKPGFHSVCP